MRAITAIMALLMPSFAACSDTGEGTTSSMSSDYFLNFKEVQVIGAVPAVRKGETWTPLCRPTTTAAGEPQTPDGVLLSTAFISYPRSDGDRDESLRPGNVLKLAASSPWELTIPREIQGTRDTDIDLTNTSH